MTDFEELKKICDRRTTMSARVVDEFLVYYAAEKDHLAREFDQRIGSYRHITQQLDPSWVRRLKSQYIIHKVFKANGQIRKYLNHVEIKRIPVEDQEFLKEQGDYPWRFSFSVIIENPHPDFYRMQDVFTGEVFLLYSRSVTEVLKEQPVNLWFNLIGSNGSCWQSFGPVIGYQSFDADDIFFFATEIDPRIGDEDMLLADVEKNAVPYMLLLMGSRSPVTVDGNDELFMLYSEHDIASIDTERLKTDFTIQHRDGVYRLSPEIWNQPPHLADVYYDEREKLLAVTSTTERSFDAVITILNQHGIDIPADPGVRVRPTMLVTAEQILKKVILFNPYEDLFQEESTPESKAEVEKLNILLGLALPEINAGRKPDIEALARQTGVDVAVAEQVLASAMERIEALKKGR
jgi:hypothetical protein